MATIKFDQVGLTPSGVAGRTRTDGFSNGAEVTITTNEPGTVQFLWVPLEDAGASASLHQVSPTVWKFTPNAAVYGTYRVKFTPNADPSAFTVRLFGIRTPNYGMRIPALNENADPNGSLLNNGSGVVESSECNEYDEDGPFADGNYGGSYSALVELMQVVDTLTRFQLQSASSQGLELSEEDGVTFLTLHFGSGAGQIAAGSDLASVSSTVGTHTSQISTHTSNIAANTASISAHTGDTANPHAVTKAQVGLSAVSNDLQLKRADNDWAGYAVQSGAPAAGDSFMIERASDGAKRRMLAASLGNVYGARDPVWDRPTTGTNDDDEMDTDPLDPATIGGARGWNFVTSGNGAMTRDGAVDLTQACATQHYRSSVVGSTLLLQVKPGDSVLLHKTVAAALSSHQIWMLGIGMPTEQGTASVGDPTVSLAFYKNNAGFIDTNNRVLLRTGTSNDRYEVNTVTAGSSLTTGTNTMNLTLFDGLALRINHGSAATGNATGFAFCRNQSLGTMLQANTPQFNAATDRLAIGLLSNPAATPAGVNSIIFAIHFLRRVSAANPGFLAQA